MSSKQSWRQAEDFSSDEENTNDKSWQSSSSESEGNSKSKPRPRNFKIIGQTTPLQLESDTSPSNSSDSGEYDVENRENQIGCYVDRNENETIKRDTAQKDISNQNEYHFGERENEVGCSKDRTEIRTSLEDDVHQSISNPVDEIHLEKGPVKKLTPIYNRSVSANSAQTASINIEHHHHHPLHLGLVAPIAHYTHATLKKFPGVTITIENRLKNIYFKGPSTPYLRSCKIQGTAPNVIMPGDQVSIEFQKDYLTGSISGMLSYKIDCTYKEDEGKNLVITWTVAIGGINKHAVAIAQCGTTSDKHLFTQMNYSKLPWCASGESGEHVSFRNDVYGINVEILSNIDSNSQAKCHIDIM